MLTVLMITFAPLILVVAYLAWCWWRDCHPAYPVWHDLDEPTRLRDSDEWMGV